jgi:hypothetical protein
MRFNTNIWKGHLDNGSPLTKLLLKLPETKDDHINATMFQCLGFLWCGGTPEEKGDVFL